MKYILSIPLLLIATPLLALTPPWYYTHGQLRAAFDGGPVKVLDLEQKEGHWLAPIAVSGPQATDTGEALATILKKSFLNSTVKVEVRLPGGAVAQPLTIPQSDPEALLKLVRTALAGNPHLSGVFSMNTGILVELKPEILQFFADNLADRHGLAHYPAANLFQDLLDFSGFPGARVFFSYDSTGQAP